MQIVLVIIYAIGAAVIGLLVGFGTGAAEAVMPLISAIASFGVMYSFHINYQNRQNMKRTSRQMLILTRAVQELSRKAKQGESNNPPPFINEADTQERHPNPPTNQSPPERANHRVKTLNTPASPAIPSPPSLMKPSLQDYDEEEEEEDYQPNPRQRGLTSGSLSAFDERGLPGGARPQILQGRQSSQANQVNQANQANDEDNAPPPQEPDIKILRNLVAQLYGVKDRGHQDKGVRPTESQLDNGLAPLRAAIGMDAPQKRGATAVQTQQSPPPKLIRDMTPDQFEATVKEAVEARRLQLYMQPIAGLPDRQPLFQECYARLVDPYGQEIMAERYLATANRLGLTAEIDQIVLFDKIGKLPYGMAKRGGQANYFCNLCAETFTDPAYFRQFLEHLETLPELLPNIILEIQEEALNRGSTELFQSLKRLRGVGFRLSLDGILNPEASFETLDRLGFHYAKIRTPSLLRYLEQNGGNRKLEEWQEIGCAIIATRIESESSLREVMNYNISLAQGFLFGAPQRVGTA